MNTRQNIRDSFLNERKGTFAVIAALFLTSMLGMVAFAVDYGYMTTSKAELQRSADAAAMAGAWELIAKTPTNSNITYNFPASRTSAVTYAGKNKVCLASPVIGLNSANATGGDIMLGYLTNSSQSTATMDYTTPTRYNAVQVKVSRTSSQNGKVPFFFAKIFGLSGQDMTATGTAAFINNIKGFNMPSDGSNLGALPITVKESNWLNSFNGTAPDAKSWNENTGTISSGSDGHHEVMLYESSFNTSNGNWGTVDIGLSNNSAEDLKDQIQNGLTQSDLDAIGGSLKLNNSGTLLLNADAGNLSGLNNALTSIIGQPRFVPIYSYVNAASGNVTDYTIVGFAGIRIMEVNLVGNPKFIRIQPANIILENPVPSDDTTTYTYGIYSPVRLVQ